MESDSLVQKWTGRQTSWFTKVDRASDFWFNGPGVRLLVQWTGRQTSWSIFRFKKRVDRSHCFLAAVHPFYFIISAYTQMMQ